MSRKGGNDGSQFGKNTFLSLGRNVRTHAPANSSIVPTQKGVSQYAYELLFEYTLVRLSCRADPHMSKVSITSRVNQESRLPTLTLNHNRARRPTVLVDLIPIQAGCTRRVDVSILLLLLRLVLLGLGVPQRSNRGRSRRVSMADVVNGSHGPIKTVCLSTCLKEPKRNTTTGRQTSANCAAKYE